MRLEKESMRDSKQSGFFYKPSVILIFPLYNVLLLFIFSLEFNIFIMWRQSKEKVSPSLCGHISLNYILIRLCNHIYADFKFKIKFQVLQKPH